MQQDDLLIDHVPEADRRVRLLLDSGCFAKANAAFDELIAAGSYEVEPRWSRAAVLIHRASLAWRLERAPLTLELIAEGWGELDAHHLEGPAAAHAISILGYLLASIGREPPALDLMTLGVEVARNTDDQATLAHCLGRAGISQLFRATAAPSPRFSQFMMARDLCDEARSVAGPGRVERTMLAGLARAQAGLGDETGAEQTARAALALATEAADQYTASVANWALATLRRVQHRTVEARTLATKALDAAESIHDILLTSQFSRDLAAICAELSDPTGEVAALRRTIKAGCSALTVLQEGLGQALMQRRIAVQAQRLADAAREAALRDPLTGLTNRLGLERRAPTLLERSRKSGHVPWLAVIDIDSFKSINDNAGHSTGDVVLQEVAHLLRRECRSRDLVCRWAGDEFVVLLVDAGEDPAVGPRVAERVRTAIAGHDWRLLLGRSISAPTVSIGVAAGPATLHQLFAAADAALFRAKRAGRNQVEVDSSRTANTPPTGEHC